jgi:hypothetical protein
MTAWMTAEWESYTSRVIATAPMMPHPLPCEATARRLGLPPPGIYEVLAEIERLRPSVGEARRLHFARAREEAPEVVKGHWVAMAARKVEEEATGSRPTPVRPPRATPSRPKRSARQSCGRKLRDPNVTAKNGRPSINHLTPAERRERKIAQTRASNARRADERKRQERMKQQNETPTPTP